MKEKEEKSEFIELTSQYLDEATENFMPKGSQHEKALLLVAIDNDSNNKKTLLKVGLVGKRDVLIPGIAKVMRDSERVKFALKEAVTFCDFLDNPRKAVEGMLEEIIKAIKD